MANKRETGKQTMTEILEQVIEGNEVIFESEDGENPEDAEVDEIVEIIEEIVEEEEEEEVEEHQENENHQEEAQSQQNQLFLQKQREEEEEEMMDEEYLDEFQDLEKAKKSRQTTSSKEKLDQFINDNFIKKTQPQVSKNQVGNGVSNNTSDSTHILAYHVEEDWEDEELEQAVHSQELTSRFSNTKVMILFNNLKVL